LYAVILFCVSSSSLNVSTRENGLTSVGLSGMKVSAHPGKMWSDDHCVDGGWSPITAANGASGFRRYSGGDCEFL
jgi:hypothetical protein